MQLRNYLIARSKTVLWFPSVLWTHKMSYVYLMYALWLFYECLMTVLTSVLSMSYVCPMTVSRMSYDWFNECLTNVLLRVPGGATAPCDFLYLTRCMILYASCLYVNIPGFRTLNLGSISKIRCDSHSHHSSLDSQSIIVSIWKVSSPCSWICRHIGLCFLLFFHVW